MHLFGVDVSVLVAGNRIGCIPKTLVLSSQPKPHLMSFLFLLLNLVLEPLAAKIGCNLDITRENSRKGIHVQLHTDDVLLILSNQFSSNLKLLDLIN